ncbi:pre-toxin TG domain-containing protein [Bacillus paralicheniformis]|uniref:pre-toxin TG domain-containing protein n=1 Tax=Bacillus paralicheniformis TaxID=1648923 RepID=UPI0003422A9D|nr:pre-toxin TG domain-containing protein [Bacillus paralicheniformis]KUL07638.1 hypothetical protein LI7559_17790 [Bacillus licheniformis LMG 7559]AGN36393.1 hypothetical protein BaLi_c20270 [Bacillus paralicheniformis ATCC 9945a]AYQ16410.1 hypothetical protein D5285_10115 [Bacillus paralicheniformis]KRT88043.1 hypothetical protein ACH97_207225 [Bacillus paralicheniformis]MCM3422615.1 pre-toxin TG domain-containing protein [Bacillus paralicheniformis]
MKKVLSVLFIFTFLFTAISTTFTMPERAFAASGVTLNEAQIKKIQKEVEVWKLLKKEYESLDKQKKALLNKKLKKAAAVVDVKLKALHKRIKKIEEKIIKEIETKIIPAINKALWVYKQTMEALDGIHEIMEQMIEAENQMIKGLDQMNDAVDGMNKSMDNVIHSMNEVSEAMDECNKALDVSIKITKDMTKETNKANANMNQMVKGINQANKGMNQLNKSTDKLNKAIKKSNKALDDYDKKSSKVKNKKITKNQAKKTKQQKEQLKRAQNKVDNANKNLKKNEKTLNEGALALSVLIDFIPLASNVKGGAEAITGKDLITGQELSGFERTLAGVSVVTSGTAKLVGRALNISEKTAKTAKVVENGEKAINAGKKANSAYDIAKNGGKHSGFYKQYIEKSPEQIKKGISSIDKQIAEHKDKIKNPEKHIPHFKSLDPRQQEALITKKWPSDIKRQQEQKQILEGILKSK